MISATKEKKKKENGYNLNTDTNRTEQNQLNRTHKHPLSCHPCCSSLFPDCNNTAYTLYTL